MQGRAAVDDDQRAHHIRAVGGQLEGDAPAEGQADDVGRGQAEARDQGGGVGGELGHAVGAGRLVRLAVAAQVEDQRLVVRREGGHLGLPVAATRAEAVDEDDRLAASL